MPDNQKEFVIQEHTSREDIHWDLMLEQNGWLRTFRLDTPPGELLTQPAQAVKIADHPLKFLTYQGPVNKGTGNVRIVESGTYTAASTSAERIELNIDGHILKGNFLLDRIESKQWEFGINGQ
jgi:hypothetical protein